MALHTADLEALVAEACALFGRAVLIDWHSMPSAAARTLGQSGDFGGAGSCDLVLGDKFGTACDGVITGAVERAFEPADVGPDSLREKLEDFVVELDMEQLRIAYHRVSAL